MIMLSQDSKAIQLHLENIHHDSADAAHRGFLIIEEERKLGLSENVKLHKRALLFCIAASSASILFGYDSVINGASSSMPAFFYYFGELGPTGYYIPSLWSSLWSAMSALFQAIGAFGIGFIADRYGRKWPTCACSALTAVGTAVQFTATSRAVLLVGKMINGFGIGAAVTVATTYASEIAPLKLRGPVQQGLVIAGIATLGIGLGVLRAFVPDVRESSFRTVFALQWMVGGLATLAFAIIPESPNFLIAHHKMPEARQSMERLYGTNAVEERLAFLTKEIREEQANQELLETGGYLECFKGSNLRRTLIVIFIYTASNFGGTSFLSNSTYFLIIAGLAAIHSFDVSIGGFGLSVMIIIASWAFDGKFRRRNAFMLGCLLNFIIMLCIGCLYFAPGIGPIWAIAILMNVLIAFQSSSLQGMGYPIAAEVSTYKLRNKTFSIGNIAQTTLAWIFGLVTPYIYNVDSGNLGARTGFVFAGFSLVLVVGAYFIVPETTGLTIEEMDAAFEAKVKASEFQKLPRGNDGLQAMQE